MAYKLDDHIEALVRMMNQQILGSDGREVVTVEIADALWEPRREGIEKEVRPFRYNQLTQVADPHQATRLEDVPLLDVELLDNGVPHLFGHERRYTEGNRRPSFPAF